MLKKVGTIVVHLIIRSSHQGCFMKKGVPRNFTEFTGKHPCQIFLFNKVAGLRTATLFKRFGHKCFPTNFAKFLKTALLQDTSGRLLLNILLICQNSLCRIFTLRYFTSILKRPKRITTLFHRSLGCFLTNFRGIRPDVFC